MSATGAERPGRSRACFAGLGLAALLGCGWVAAQGVAAGPAPASAPAASPSVRLEVCTACHGADGRSRQAGVPSLAGQPRLFLENRLVMIREGLSVVPEMKGLLDALSDAELIELSRHFAALPPPPPASPRDAARAARGARIAERTLCGSCHLPDHRGREQIPRLAGQREDYLLGSMRQFLAGQVKGRDTAMINALQGLADADLVDLAHYLATEGPAAP